MGQNSVKLRGKRSNEVKAKKTEAWRKNLLEIWDFFFKLKSTFKSFSDTMMYKKIIQYK